jgi:hypothetical protein
MRSIKGSRSPSSSRPKPLELASDEDWQRAREVYWRRWDPSQGLSSWWIGEGVMEISEVFEALLSPDFQITVRDERMELKRVKSCWWEAPQEPREDP